MDENGDNSVFSPVSISTLLSILQQGALGRTLQELSDVLHADAEDSRKIYGHLIYNLKVIHISINI